MWPFSRRKTDQLEISIPPECRVSFPLVGWKEIRAFKSHIDIEDVDDYKYAIFELHTIKALIAYQLKLNQELGLKYEKDGWDCDDFSAFWKVVCRIALTRSCPGLEASALCATVCLKQKGGGLHAMIAIPYRAATGHKKILYVEPQNGKTYEEPPGKIYKIKL